MAKLGIRRAEARNILGNTEYAGWSLCIGAGTSLPFFPTWQTLVQDLLTSAKPALSKTDAEKIRQSYPPEALIRAAQELSGLADEAFRESLTQQLYSSIKARASDKWLVIAKCLMARMPGDVLASEWTDFVTFAAHEHTTAGALAEVVLGRVHAI